MRSKEITRQAVDPDDPIATDERDIFEMANLYPGTTGLPMPVWVSPRGTARHDVWIKVKMTHGDQMNISNTAVVGVRPAPRLISGRLSPADTQSLFQWLTLNADALVAYWDGRIDTARMVRALKALPATGQPDTLAGP